MATLTYTFGPSKNYGTGTDWRRQILIGSLDNLTTVPSGSIKSIELSFVVRNAISGENPIEIALTKNFNKETAGSWDTTLKENKGYEYQTSNSTSSYYTANRANLFFADEDYLIRTGTSINIPAPGNQSITINWNIISEDIQDLSKWPTKLYLALLDLDDNDDDSYYCLWASDKTAQLTIEYDEESEGSVDSTILGQASIFTIKSKNSSYKHTVTWQCGEDRYTTEVNPEITTCSYTIPTIWGKYFPNAMSYSGSDAKIVLTTYTQSGTQVGRPKTYPVTYTIPDYSVQAEIEFSGITHGEYFKDSSFAGIRDTLYTNKSMFDIDISSVSQYGETFSYQIKNGQNGNLIANGVRNKYTGLKVESFSSFTVYIIVKDSRGKILNISRELEITNYLPPKIDTVTIYRCDSSGTRNDDNGKYVNIKVKYTSATNEIKGVTNSTNCLITVNNEKKSANSEIGVILGKGNLSTDNNYSYTVELTDTAGSKISKTGSIGAVNYLLHFRKREDLTGGYQSLGIGCPAPSANNRLDIGWTTYITGGELQVPLLRIRNSTNLYPAIAFHSPTTIPEGSASTDFNNLSVGVINCNTSANSRRIYFEEYPLTKGAEGEEANIGSGAERLREQYWLPKPSNNLTKSAIYNIHTTKTVIAPEHGGTGVTNLNDLKNSLSVPNIIYRDILPDFNENEHNNVICLVPVST